MFVLRICIFLAGDKDCHFLYRVPKNNGTFDIFQKFSRFFHQNNRIVGVTGSQKTLHARGTEPLLVAVMPAAH
jgi:hypothetical protein